MKYYKVPETYRSEQAGRGEDWIDLESIEAVQGYKDGTITIMFKSGNCMKYGPFEPDVYDKVMDKIIEENVEQ